MLLSGSSWAPGHHTSKLFSATKVTRNFHFFQIQVGLNELQASLGLFAGVQKLELSENPPVPEK